VAPGVVPNWASQNDVGGFGNFATAYDNFRLGTTSTVNTVTWQGGYFNTATQNPISAFTLTFYSDNGGQPGTPLSSQRIPGNANETFVGFEQGTIPGGNLNFNYSTDLLTPFVADANTQYWLSIVPDLNNVQWGWHTGTGGDSIFFQDFFGVREKNPDGMSTDLAFSLIGTPNVVGGLVIPEPASLAVWGALGLAGLGYGWRRRKAQAG
jgi:hypothetical protein